MSNNKSNSNLDILGILDLGQEIKNYRELCSLLNLDVKDGNSKIAQMKEIARFYKLRQIKYGFIVEEVYSNPLPKEDGRVNNGGHIGNSKYDDLMDRVIINLLIDYGGLIEDSFSEIMSMMCFFTDKYVGLNKSGHKSFSKINNIGSGVTLTYQQKLNNIAKYCFESSLNRLSRQGVIHYEKRILVRNNRFEEYLADRELEALISLTEKQVYEEMGIKYYNRILMEVNRKFKNKVANKLEIMSYWNVYCFELVDKKMDYVEEDRGELIKRLVESVITSVKNHKMKKDEDEFKPYSYKKYQSQIDKLTRLIWNLPEGYNTRTEECSNLVLLFGNTNTEQQIDEVNIMFDIYDYNEYNRAIPF